MTTERVKELVEFYEDQVKREKDEEQRKVWQRILNGWTVELWQREHNYCFTTSRPYEY